MATISELSRKLSITRKTAAKYFHEWMDKLLERVQEQMAAVKEELVEAVAVPSDGGSAAPESFIAYIPAPRGERCSVRSGRVWENDAGARRIRGNDQKDGKGETIRTQVAELMLCGNSS